LESGSQNQKTLTPVERSRGRSWALIKKQTLKEFQTKDGGKGTLEQLEKKTTSPTRGGAKREKTAKGGAQKGFKACETQKWPSARCKRK